MNESEVVPVVRGVLESMGFDVQNRLEMQKQMQALREIASLMADEEFKADLYHLRTWRLATEKARSIGFITVLTTIVTGAAGALWLGFRELLK